MPAVLKSRKMIYSIQKDLCDSQENAELSPLQIRLQLDDVIYLKSQLSKAYLIRSLIGRETGKERPFIPLTDRTVAPAAAQQQKTVIPQLCQSRERGKFKVKGQFLLNSEFGVSGKYLLQSSVLQSLSVLRFPWNCPW